MKIQIFILFICFSFHLFGQLSDDPVLVKVGNLEISKSEFENRLNFTPKEGIHDRTNSEGIKKELIYTMIAEKLWANEAIEIGLENNSSVVTAKNVIEKMFVRDELYRREIKDKINISEKEIKEAEERYSKLLDVIVFFTEGKNEINDLAKQIKKVKSIELLFTKIDTNIILNKEVILSFGDLQKSTEDLLFNLKVNQFSEPIEMETGWNVFYLKNITQRKYSSLKEKNIASKFISKTLKKRQEQTNYNKFYSEFFKNKKIDADGKLFMLVVNNLNLIFKKKEAEQLSLKDNSGKSKILFDSYDLKELEEKLGKKILSENFIRFKSNPINLKTFLREISFSSFSVPSSNIDSIKIYLNKKLRNYIKYEMLAREGYRRGLDKAPNVLKWVKIWYENFLFQKIKNSTIQLDENDEIENSSTENKEEIPGENRFKKFINQTIELADKYKYKINEKLFESIQQGNINLFVVRNLGFGGRITGVPSSPPFIQWYLEKEKRNKPNL